MYLKAFLIISLLAASVGADCVDTCIKSYVNSVLSHTSSQILICQDIENFVRCVFGPGCQTSGISENDILNLMNEYLKLYGFSCSFSTTDLYNKYKNSGSHVNTLSIPLVLTLSLGISALQWAMRSIQAVSH